MQIEAKKRDGGRKVHAAPTVWATENPVSVTEIPVTLTVEPEPPALRPAGEGLFRAENRGISEGLTNKRHLL